MTSLEKLEGLISAIEGEAKQASPSHANLARLTALALREFLLSLSEPAPQSAVEEKSWPVVDEPPTAPESDLPPTDTPEPKHHAKRHKAKK